MANETKLVSGSVEKRTETIVERNIIGKIDTYEVTKSDIYALTGGGNGKITEWLLSIFIGADITLWITYSTTDFGSNEFKEGFFLASAIFAFIICVILAVLYCNSRSSTKSLIDEITNKPS